MDFDQLLEMIPVFLDVNIYRASRDYALAEGCHGIIVLYGGHVTVTPQGEKPVICAEGYALHPDCPFYRIEVPHTREAEYAIITYRIIPEGRQWLLRGPLHSFGTMKIRYMLDELLRDREQGAEDEFDRASLRFQERLLLERILYIYLRETWIKRKGQASSGTFEQSLSYLNEHYMLPLTLPMIAERAGVSVGHYTVLFKRSTGLTFSQYLRQIRIEKAKQLLRQTDLSASEIARQVGYADYFHFSRTFKRETGCSPAAFAKQSSDMNSENPTYEI